MCEKQILETTFIKQHAFLVDPLRVSFDLCTLQHLHVETPSGAMTCIRSFLNQGLFSKSFGLMLASHAISHGCFVALALFSTASRIASFLGDRPSLRVSEVCCKHSHPSTHIYPHLGNHSFVSWDGYNCSFFLSNNCSQIAVACNKNSS